VAREPHRPPIAEANTLSRDESRGIRRLSRARRGGRNKPASPLGRHRSTRIHPRPRSQPGAGRAPAWHPPAFRRRPPGAARCEPRRRRWGFVMRRRPTAVYRVIDEEELLGGGSELIAEGMATPVDLERASSGRARRRLRFDGAWGSTAAAVVGLSGIAALLLATSTHAPASLRPPRLATSSRQSPPSGFRPAALTATTRPHTKLREHGRGRPRVTGRSQRRRLHRRVLHREDRSRNTSAQLARAQSVKPPVGSATEARPVQAPEPDVTPARGGSTGPSGEFGFER